MIAILIAISLFAFLLSVMIAAQEIVSEKDWPRDTGWYPLVFMASAALLALAV